MKHALALLFTLVVQLHAADACFGLPSKPAEAAGFFRLGKTLDRHYLVTPTGHAYLALSSCQYIDRPAGFGRGLRQGILKADGTPREAFVSVYREHFAAALKNLQTLTTP